MFIEMNPKFPEKMFFMEESDDRNVNEEVDAEKDDCINNNDNNED